MPLQPPISKKEISDLPRVLREALETGRAEYDELLRRTAWGDPPVYFVGSGTCHSVARYAAEVFETLLGWACSSGIPVEFSAEALLSVRLRSVFWLISDGNDAPEMLEVLNAVRKRNGIVLALVPNPEDPLAKAADGVFLARAAGEGGVVRRTICLQATVGCIALLTAKALKRNCAQFETLEREFLKLPSQVSWALTQLREPVRALASELTRAENLYIYAEGAYSAIAASSAALLNDLAGIHSQELNLADNVMQQGNPCGRDATLLILSGSRARAKKQVQRTFEWAKRGGGKILSMTDGNDSILARKSAMTLLLPTLSEPAGAILAHVIMAWAAYEARGLARPSPNG